MALNVTELNNYLLFKIPLFTKTQPNCLRTAKTEAKSIKTTRNKDNHDDAFLENKALFVEVAMM